MFLVRKTRRLFQDQLDREGFFTGWRANFEKNVLSMDPEEWMMQVRQQFWRYFFFDPKERQKRLMLIHFHQQDAILQRADQILNHRFDLLTESPVSLGERLPWHSDYLSGYTWDPDLPFYRCSPASYPGGYDIKVPWELSRFQFGVWLGIAYAISGRKEYALEWVKLVEDWINRNPVGAGVNWACTMDVAIRVVNWLWAYAFFADSPYLSPVFHLSFLKSLWEHGRFIERHLENNVRVTSNHYLANLVGLGYLGTLMPLFPESYRWRSWSWREFQRELYQQVYGDGVSFEASSGYHRLVTEMALSFMALMIQNHVNVPVSFSQRVQKMLDALMWITQPNGTFPLLGDHDNGRLHRLKIYHPPEREWVDGRHLLAVGAVLFKRLDFARAAGDEWEDAIWMFGESARLLMDVSSQESPSHEGVKVFSRGGWCVYRKPQTMLTIEWGDVGHKGRGAHAHNDTLSFTFFSRGISWLVDSGTFAYTGDYLAYALSRSSGMHNLSRPVNVEQNLQDQRIPFRTWRKGQVKQFICQENDEWFQAKGIFLHWDGIHILERRWLCNGQTGILLVADRILPESQKAELFLHLNWELDLIQQEQGKFIFRAGDDLLGIYSLTPSGRWWIEDGKVAVGYGIMKKASILRACFESGWMVYMIGAFKTESEWQTGQNTIIREGKKIWEEVFQNAESWS